jgi:hypothetical protein
MTQRALATASICACLTLASPLSAEQVRPPCGKEKGDVCESSHWPLLARNGQSVKIRARFAAPDGIKSIQLTIQHAPLGDCGGNSKSLVACGVDPWKIEVRECRFLNYEPLEGIATCEVNRAFAENWVTYDAQATTRTGNILNAPQVSFAASNISQNDGLLPVLYHSDPKTSHATVRLSFAHSQDYGDGEGYYDFLDDLRALLEGAFHGSHDYANLYSRSDESFDLWLTPSRVHVDQSCKFMLPVENQLEGALVNVAIALHSNLYRDCALVSIGGPGATASVYAGSHESPFILVHETGHSVFGLADEYGCGGWHDNAGYCTNVFASSATCKAAAKKWSTSCEPLLCNDYPLDPQRWRIQSAQSEIMKGPMDTSNWRNESLRCVANGLDVDPSRSAAPTPPLVQLDANRKLPAPPSRTGVFPPLTEVVVIQFQASADFIRQSHGCNPAPISAPSTRVQIPAGYSLAPDPIGKPSHNGVLSLISRDQHRLMELSTAPTLVREGQPEQTVNLDYAVILPSGTDLGSLSLQTDTCSRRLVPP